MQQPAARHHIGLTCLAFIMAACPEDDACSTECKADSTSIGSTSTATTPSVPTSGGGSTSSTTDGSTSSTSDSQESSGAGSGNIGSGESGTGQQDGPYCAGFGPRRCAISGRGFCADVAALCESSIVSDEECSGIAAACLDNTTTPCGLCKAMWDSCVAATGDVLDPKCESLGESCGCIVSSHS
jgi:hypothetical protein